MEHEKLTVNSFFLQSSHEVSFYIRYFSSITGYIYLASNFNKYYFIITDETETTILSIKENIDTHKTNPEFDKQNITFICSSDEQILWCHRYGFLTETQTFVDSQTIYSPTLLTEKSSWAYKDIARLCIFYKGESLQILHLEGLDHHWDILPLLDNRTRCLVSWPCYFHKLLYEHNVNALYTQNPLFDRKNIVFLAPNLDGILFSYEYGFHSILANQNCLIDYELFKIMDDGNVKAKYDMVMNCRPEMWKRPFLAEKVDNLAYIKGYNYGAEVYDYNKLHYMYTNDRRLEVSEIVLIYNQSSCGGIFSEKEGACYVSSEYLLCGLPVISTESRGGRNTWYTKENSIIVEADEDAVLEAVQVCMENVETGKMDRHQIRQTHIETTNQMRERIIRCCQYMFDLSKIEMDARGHWRKTYFHTLLKTVPLHDAIDLLRTK